jgi:hypothetical protein
VLATTEGVSGTVNLNVPEGRHSLEFWGEDETGVVEPAHHTVEVVVDRTAPSVSITGATRFTIGDAASASVTASDPISGLASDPSAAAVPVDTSTVGERVLTRSATDRCGNVGTRTLTYRVAAPLLLSCQRTAIVLIDVVRAGSKVRITGQADPANAGKAVSLLLSDKRRKRSKRVVVGSARIGPTGAFAATVAKPKKSIKTPQYLARDPAGKRSKALELDRRMFADSVSVSGRRITIHGHVTKPFPRKRGQVVTVSVQKDCASRTVAGRPKLNRRGRFSLTFTAPADAPEVLVRATTKVPTRAGGASRFSTFTLPRPVSLR